MKLKEAIIQSCKKHKYHDVLAQQNKSVYTFLPGIATPEKIRVRIRNQKGGVQPSTDESTPTDVH